jgi:hypothetical protein
MRALKVRPMSEKPSIPYAVQIEVITDPPRKILHVKTLLPLNSSTAHFDTARLNEMLKAIAEVVGPRYEYDAYVVHGPDGAREGP